MQLQSLSKSFDKHGLNTEQNYHINLFCRGIFQQIFTIL